MADVSPPNYSTAVGRVRALIPDIEQVDWESDGNPSYMFSDSHLSGFLALYGADPGTCGATAGVELTAKIRHAAADAVEAIAVSEALISKVVKTEDLQTDGAKTANALLGRAGLLRRQAAKEEEQEDLETAFTVVDFHPSRNHCEPPRVPNTPEYLYWRNV